LIINVNNRSGDNPKDFSPESVQYFGNTAFKE